MGIGFQNNVLFAAETCSVSNQASPEFREYQNKLNSELGKIRGEMAAKTCWATPFSNTSIEREKSKWTDLMYSIINETRDLNTLQSSFRFNISRLLFSDDLPLLRRERNTLTNQAKAIEQIVDEMFGRCAGALPYKSGTLQSNLSQIYADHVRFTAYFESVASGWNWFSLPSITPKVIGNNPDWLTNITSSYKPEWLKPCYEEGTTMIGTWERIVKIWTGGASISKWIQAWQDVYSLLIGTDPNYNAKQKKLLSSYLSENGITGDARDNIMSRLDCKQKGGSNCGWPVSFGGIDGIVQMKNEAIGLYTDMRSTMVNFRKMTKETQTQYANALKSYQWEGGVAGAFKNLKNIIIPVPDVDTQSIITDSNYSQDLEYIHLTTQNLYTTLQSKSSSDFTDQASIDNLKAINQEVYTINEKLKWMEKLSIYMCKSQDTGLAWLCIK